MLLLLPSETATCKGRVGLMTTGASERWAVKHRALEPTCPASTKKAVSCGSPSAHNTYAKHGICVVPEPLQSFDSLAGKLHGACVPGRGQIVPAAPSGLPRPALHA
jgi:hypothetical protein